MADTKINVAELEAVDSVKNGDTMLIITQNDSGDNVARRVDATLFKGEDAYSVAVSKGYTGSYDEWKRLISTISESADELAKISDVDTSFDQDTGEVIVSVG